MKKLMTGGVLLLLLSVCACQSGQKKGQEEAQDTTNMTQTDATMKNQSMDTTTMQMKKAADAIDSTSQKVDELLKDI